MNLPQARTANLIEQDLGSELLIYNLQTNKAYTLNETSAAIYKACDGQTSFEKLKDNFKFSDELIHLALSELQENNLLEGEYVSPFTKMNRREIIRKAALASMIALPVIIGITTPKAARASSTNRSCNNGAGTCYAPNENICAGRSGQITRSEYGSTNGSCSGAPTSTVQRTCSGAAFRTVDACITGG